MYTVVSFFYQKIQLWRYWHTSLSCTGQETFNVGDIINNRGIIVIGGEGHHIYQQDGKSSTCFNSLWIKHKCMYQVKEGPDLTINLWYKSMLIFDSRLLLMVVIKVHRIICILSLIKTQISYVKPFRKEWLLLCFVDWDIPWMVYYIMHFNWPLL